MWTLLAVCTMKVGSLSNNKRSKEEGEEEGGGEGVAQGWATQSHVIAGEDICWVSKKDNAITVWDACSARVQRGGNFFLSFFLFLHNKYQAMKY